MGVLTKPNSMRHNPDAKLNITSMMDMFTIILVFLLFSFSSEKDPEFDPSLHLPDSSSRIPYSEAITVALTQDALKLNSKVVLNLKRGHIPASEMEGDKITALFEALSLEKKRVEEDKNIKDPLKKTLVLFQADKDAEFSQIDPVMKTTGMAGFPNFRFAVARAE